MLCILFGGESCAVCNVLSPKLDAEIRRRFPDLKYVYINCNNAPEICAQHTVFSLPVVKVFIEGMQVAEENGAFAIEQLMRKIERPYSLWIDS